MKAFRHYVLYAAMIGMMLSICATPGCSRRENALRPDKTTLPLRTQSHAPIVTNRLERKLVFITGEVKSPGYCEWRKKMLASDLLKAGGGGTTFADLRRVHICHVNGSNVSVDLRSPINRNDHDLVLQPGDVVRVPRRM
jgi:protein involved in polysaccharide export with SLBB domain